MTEIYSLKKSAQFEIDIVNNLCYWAIDSNKIYYLTKENWYIFEKKPLAQVFKIDCEKHSVTNGSIEKDSELIRDCSVGKSFLIPNHITKKISFTEFKKLIK